MKVVEKRVFSAEETKSEIEKGLELFQSEVSFVVKSAHLYENAKGNTITVLESGDGTIAKLPQHTCLQVLEKAGFVKRGEPFTLEAKVFVNLLFARTKDTTTFTPNGEPALTDEQKAKIAELVGLGVPEETAKAKVLATA